ncbi:MAG: SAM-dependent methyltransferase [Rhodobacteraceae bacterium]|nr:SAM-dependent methyltransferase [Paracoccaceae bacterium]
MTDTTRPPAMTDRTALARNRARAGGAMAGGAMFLHERAADEIKERLSEVNRRFTAPAVVTGFADFWANVLPGAVVVPDTPTLALQPDAHDLVIHALALHWADDPVGQLVQCRHALRPDGLFLGVLFGGQTLAELRAALAEAEVALTGGLSPRVLPMAEIRDLGGLMQRAGFALPVADGTACAVDYASAWHLMRDLRAMGEGNALAARHRRPAPRALFAEAARRYAGAFPAPGGRVRAGFEMIFLTGWAPAPDQPQPLRPGSAAQRLADALGAREHPLAGT